MFGKTQKIQRNPWGDDHPEKIKSSSPHTIGLNDQVKGLFSPDKMFDHFFGGDKDPVSPVLSEKANKTNKSEMVLFSRVHKEEERKITQEANQILNKLKEQITILEKSEKSLVSEVSKIKVDKLPEKTGIYYIRYLEWLLSVVKQLRMKVEEGHAWLSTFNQRKKKKLGYWKMYKKHGTTFGLSHERTLATQTG